MICHTGKIPYVSQGEARTMLRVLQATPRTGLAGGQDVYRCPHCGYWHLGRKKKWKRGGK